MTKDTLYAAGPSFTLLCTDSMFRKSVWRNTVSEAVSACQDQALNTTIFLLKSYGPTGFLLKEDRDARNYKVNHSMIQDAHCSKGPEWSGFTVQYVVLVIFAGVLGRPTYMHLLQLQQGAGAMQTHLLVSITQKKALFKFCSLFLSHEHKTNKTKMYFHNRVLLRRFKLPREHECKLFRWISVLNTIANCKICRFGKSFSHL